MDVVINPTTIISNDGAIIINLEMDNSNGPFFFSIDEGITWKSPDVKYGTSKTYNGLPPGNYVVMISRGSPGKCVTSRSYVLKAEFCCGKCSPSLTYVLRVKIPEQPFPIPNGGLFISLPCLDEYINMSGTGTVVGPPGGCTYNTLQEYRTCVGEAILYFFVLIGAYTENYEVIGDTIVYHFSFLDNFQVNTTLLNTLCNCGEFIDTTTEDISGPLQPIKATLTKECCLDRVEQPPPGQTNLQEYFCSGLSPGQPEPPLPIVFTINTIAGVYDYIIRTNTCCYDNAGQTLELLLPLISSLEVGKLYTFEIYNVCCEPGNTGRSVKINTLGGNTMIGTNGNIGPAGVNINNCRVSRATILVGYDTGYNVFEYNNTY